MSEFVNDFDNEFGDELKEDFKEHVGKFINDLGDLQELHDLFSKDRLFQMQLIHEMIEEELEEEMDHDEFFEEEDDDDVVEELQGLFNEFVLLDDELSLREKGILGYALFANDGDIEINTLTEMSSVTKQTIQKSLKKLEKLGFIRMCKNCDCYHLDLETLDAEHLHYAEDNLFSIVLSVEHLSWEAKAIYLWLEINAHVTPERIKMCSTDKLSVVEKAYAELKEAGLMSSEEQHFHLNEHDEYKHKELKLKTKGDIKDWYEKELKELLINILAINPPSPNLINVRFPTYGNMNPVQVATVADDPDMLLKLLGVEGIYLPKEIEADTLGEIHPLMLALEMESFQVIPLLLGREEFITDRQLVTECLDGIIEGRASVTCLKHALEQLKSTEYYQWLTNFLLFKSVLSDREDHAHVLIEAGASPYTPVFDGEETAMDFVIKHGYHSFMRLFERLAG